MKLLTTPPSHENAPVSIASNVSTPAAHRTPVARHATLPDRLHFLAWDEDDEDDEFDIYDDEDDDLDDEDDDFYDEDEFIDDDDDDEDDEDFEDTADD